MLRALPVLIIIGLAIYSFFDVLKTDELLIRRGPKTMWMILALVPVVGAALWFLLGRPVREAEAYPPPRVISLKRGSKQVAPDDDASFLRKLEQDAWLRKRDEARAKEAAAAEADAAKSTSSANSDKNAATPPETVTETSDEATEGKTKAKEQPPGEQDL